MTANRTPFRVNRDASDHQYFLVDVGKRSTVAIKNQRSAVEVEIWPYRNLDDEFPLSRCTAPLPEQFPSAKAKPSLQLFFLSDEGPSEFNTDLFVWAHSAQEAVACWRAYYGTEEVAQRDPDNIWPVPTTATRPGAIAWNHPDGLMTVAP